MYAGLNRVYWANVLLSLFLLSSGCVSLPPPGHGLALRYTPREPVLGASTSGPSTEAPNDFPSSLGLETLKWQLSRRASHRETAVLDPDNEEKTTRQSALATQLAFRSAVLYVADSAHRICGEFSRLKTSGRGIAGGTGVFIRYIDYGVEQLRWIDTQHSAATRLANAASEMDDPDMQLSLLCLAGPPLEAAMMGSLLLAVWLDLLNLADAVLVQHLYGVERMFTDLWRWQKMIKPAMTALSSLEPVQVEAASQDVPALVGHLSGELATTIETVRKGAENVAKVLVLKEAIEALTMLSALRFALPSMPPSAPAVLGIGIIAGGDGVMMSTRIIVSSEWVEMMRQLVHAGVLSLPVVGAAVRIQTGQVMLSQAHGNLPSSVREALGDGPEVRAMRETGRTGAGMAEPPRHHVMPKEFRAWFEKRGFTGEMDIDRFCVELERAHHEAIHGGGNWRLGRTWPDEWNQMIMNVLRQSESKAGRMLTPNAILKLVAREMKRYKIPMNFVPGRM